MTCVFVSYVECVHAVCFFILCVFISFLCLFVSFLCVFSSFLCVFSYFLCVFYLFLMYVMLFLVCLALSCVFCLFLMYVMLFLVCLSLSFMCFVSFLCAFTSFLCVFSSFLCVFISSRVVISFLTKYVFIYVCLCGSYVSSSLCLLCVFYMCVSLLWVLSLSNLLFLTFSFSSSRFFWCLRSLAAQILLSGAQQVAIAVCVTLATAIVLVAANR